MEKKRNEQNPDTTAWLLTKNEYKNIRNGQTEQVKIRGRVHVGILGHHDARRDISDDTREKYDAIDSGKNGYRFHTASLGAKVVRQVGIPVKGRVRNVPKGRCPVEHVKQWQTQKSVCGQIFDSLTVLLCNAAVERVHSRPTPNVIAPV